MLLGHIKITWCNRLRTVILLIGCCYSYSAAVIDINRYFKMYIHQVSLLFTFDIRL